MTSVERIIDYIDILPEASLERADKDIEVDADWPTEGSITSRGVSMKYFQNSKNILNNITFHIKAREKVNIFTNI